MNTFFTTIAICCFCLNIGFSQIGINTPTPDPSAALDISSTDKGILIPRIADLADIMTPANGLLVYNTSESSFYFYDGSSWKQIDADVNILIDADNDTKIQVESSLDEDKIRMDIAGTERFVLESDSTGRSRIIFPNNNDNIAFGPLTLSKNTGGDRNIAFGYESLRENVSGNDNIAVGFRSLQLHAAGSNNVAIGNYSLARNVSSGANTALGHSALSFNISGNENVALGTSALTKNTTGGRNVAGGNAALFSNISGNNNVAFGFASMQFNETGGGNVAIGTSSLRENITGTSNVAIGINTMQFSDSGASNLAVGADALNKLDSGNGNVALGKSAFFNLIDGSNNVAIGNGAGASVTSESNKLYINNSTSSADNSLIYGDFASDFVVLNNRLSVGMPIADFNSNMILAVRGNGGGVDTLIACEDDTSTDRFEVYSNGNAWLSGTLTEASDRRLKKDIQPLMSSLTSILSLNGYNYNWIDTNSSPNLQTGVIAQEVLEVFPELVETDKAYYSVNYIGLIPHLIEGIKEQQTIIEDQKSEIELMKAELESIKMTIEELSAKM
jgi:hypothetical protein